MSDTRTLSPKTTKGERLREHLLGLIDNELGARDRIPTERRLAETFGMSRLTVRRVLERLELEGRVYRTQGSGTFVSEPRISKSLELTSFSEDMRARGLRPGAVPTDVTEVAADADIAARLRISPASLVVRIKRIRTADGSPMCIETTAIPSALVPGIIASDLTGSLYEALANTYHLGIVTADQHIEATVVDPAAAAELDVAPFSPAFRVRRVARDARDRRIEYTESLYRADRYSYDLTIHRTGGAQ